ncbi:FAD-dependent monooxygenase [Myxococcus sp. CA056]|uniref:FAD-dependent oxidoreductase n=1 Tax=unclassified Myxococcus TaxID=2648731 RepID=UPI00157B22EC|nr:MULTISPECIES: NAD(P)/FAD-dependent oxidoreductase [unclassified Myxococcus]NTX13642.1 FAD-dependent monooxygenase [Myxococcus sp. CA056]NTX38941.1 FAD-dependent monooxygenase [Myxococcus sp. CA033]NTX50503.1 FAD-dependent monooxygenase [Myxococcus sp. CA039A]
MHKAIIVGGGLAGSLTAIYLARRGYDVRVVERRRDPLQNTFSSLEMTSSRAIGVSMNVRGIKAVLRAGIEPQELKRCGEPIAGMAFSVGGKYRIRELTPSEGISPLSLDRLAFQRLLNKHAALLGVKYHFESRCLGVDLEKKSVLVQENDGGVQRHQGDLIIGADGAHSAVRQSMQSGLRRFEFKQTFFRHGYKTLVLTNAAELGYRKDLLYFFGMDSKGLFAGRAATIPGDSISFAICLPYTGALSLATQDGDTLRAFFNHYFGGLPLARRQEMLEQFMTLPSNDLVNVRSSTFHYRGNAVLMGDAAHATAPFMGQGMNMALEDAYVFSTLLDKHAHDLEVVLPEFTRQRKVQADAMQDMSIANYEMLSNPRFIFFLRAQYARYMHQKFPSLYPPDMAEKLYFDSVPYDELQRIQRKQNVWYKLGRMN